MTIDESDALIGAVALEIVLAKFKLKFEAEQDYRGAFSVLSRFRPEQLVGFVQALEETGTMGLPVQLQFPEGISKQFEVPPQHLTVDSAVKVRNKSRGNGLITIAAATEPDEISSLSDSDSLDADDLKKKEVGHIWVDFVARRVDLTLLPEDRKKLQAMLKGLFDTGRCPTGKAGEFLMSVLKRFKDGEIITRAAGKSLPIIGLPLFEDCFSSLNEAKMALAHQWSTKFKSHYQLECYLDKRGQAQELLDPEILRQRLSTLRSPDQQPPIPEPILEAFQTYIESDGTRSTATENLLFKFDWNFTTFCFEKSKRSSAKDFVDRTESALRAEGITPSPDDEVVLHALTKIARKPASASEEFREFFDRRQEALEKDARLFLEWEDFIHGKKIECFDLFQGIFNCTQRAIRGLSSIEGAYVVIEGKQQTKPNSFLEVNQRACEFFERAYGELESRTNGQIRFKDTLICKYSQEVLPQIGDKKKFKGSSKTGKATTLNFLVSVFQEKPDGLDRKILTLSLAWKFPIGSVLGQEEADLDAICRYHAKRKTALVSCVADYEVVGRKGLPVSLSLENVEGFADVARGGARGAFIPAQDRIESLAAQWKEILAEAETQHWLTAEQITELSSDFDAFESIYAEGVIALRKSALAFEKSFDVSVAYRRLLLSIKKLNHQDACRQLLRVILKVGLAKVERSGLRPPVAVVCPWHPLRMEASAARYQQVFSLLDKLLGKDRAPFSDGATGPLFFREVNQLLSHPLYPEIAAVWDKSETLPRIVSQGFSAYSLHQPPEPSSESEVAALDNDSKSAAATIEHEMVEYLRLQPHERDNFSILLYNCDSPNLATSVVNSINRINDSRKDGNKITCQVLLMHRHEEHLRQVYRELVAKGVETEADPTEASGDFLAKVRVNITAANRLRREGRSQPVDIAYCRDLISEEAKPIWAWVPRETADPQDLQPHQWSRRLPVKKGDRRVLLQLACPAQTETGWAYLYAIASLCAQGADEAWTAGQCPVLMRCLDFDDKAVERIFKETHDLATWVINQDELLDRRLLEEQRSKIKVIRYVQSATHGRNLIISSNARETLLVNTLREKLKALLPSETATDVIDSLCVQFIEDANKISGGLVLKAARRANNTNELLGMVLSRYLVQSELGATRPVAWCFLDDYSQWLGKKEGANIADLLVLAPTTHEDGSMHLDIVVTEAKFVTHDGLRAAATTSSKQLMDTLSQLTEAMDGNLQTIDQDIWLARLSDLIVSQTAVVPGEPSLDTNAWRRAIRQRECSVKIWGYSHVFVNESPDITAQISTAKGIPSDKGRADLDSLQEIFGPGHVRSLILDYHSANFTETTDLRLRNGHPPFGHSKLYFLSSKPEGPKENGDEPPDDPTDGGLVDPPPPTPPPIAPQAVETDAPTSEPSEPPEPIASSITESERSDGSPNELVAFLEARSALYESSDEEGRIWLETTTTRLRQALVSRGLPAKLLEEHPPILTPNAAIIKLQGSKDLTVQAVESRAGEIFTSDGIKIINTSPESGRVSIAIERPNREVLHTEPVLLSYLRSYSQETLGEKLCVGIREEDGLPLLLDPLNQPHTLIAGITGSGKSVLMQNLILSIAATRSPNEAHIYLIDPKYGVDYRPLDELPHVGLGSGGVVDDPDAAVQILRGLVDQMNERYELFKEAKVPNIHAYRRATGKPLPTLWIIHDEFADWMQTEDYKETVPNIVGRLSVKARAAGIFLLFAAQRPDKDVMPLQLRSQLGNRLILKVDNSGTAEIAMGIKNSGAERLLGRGHMLAKTGDTPEPIFAQVPFIDMEHTIPEIVRLICNQYRDLVEIRT